jgi:hypothetical protein
LVAICIDLQRGENILPVNAPGQVGKFHHPFFGFDRVQQVFASFPFQSDIFIFKEVPKFHAKMIF